MLPRQLLHKLQLPNMGLTTWKGERVRKSDVGTAKNYLAESEIRELNLIVTMFLDTVELRATRRQQIMLMEWEGILDGFLRGNELPVLRDAGHVSGVRAEQIAHERYQAFDEGRKGAERLAAEVTDEFDELKRTVKSLHALPGNGTITLTARV